jgi:alpha-galactosidase
MRRVELAGIVAVLLFALVQAGLAWAEPPAEEAMGVRERWVGEHVSPGGASAEPSGRRAPFAFLYGGRSSRDAMAGWKHEASVRTLDPERTEHVHTWTDPATGLQVRMTGISYKDLPAVEWLLHFTNTGKADTPIIESIRPLDMNIENRSELVLHHALGDSNSAESFKPVAERIAPEDHVPRVFAPVGGRSSDGHMPYFNIEEGGKGVVIAIGWAGQWRAEFVQRENGFFSMSAGQELTHFVLHPGETVRTPRIILAFWRGDDAIAGNNVLRRLILAHYAPRRDGRPLFPPICGSVVETARDGSYEEPHVAAMPTLARRGIEVFWFDMDPQHWYGEFPKDTGTWEPDPKKLPHGLAPLGKAAHAAGLKFLLWFEPERVHPGTKIDKLHPEWVMKAQGEWSQLFRLHDAEARRWLTDTIDAQVTAGGVDWIRWDFNVPPLGFWRRNDAADRQGITEIRHVEGLYAMWQELARRHPGLLIDICAAGGRRLDFETCSYGMPLWHSDLQCVGRPSPAADQLQNSGLWRWVPLDGCGVFELEPAYGFRSAMTAGNIIAAKRDGRLATGAPGCEEEVKRTVAFYNKVRPYMLGDFYPLVGHDASETVWHGYQFDRPEHGDGMAMIFRRGQCTEPRQTVALRGVDPTGRYEVSFEDSSSKQTLSGAELAHLAVEIPTPPGSVVVYYRRL